MDSRFKIGEEVMEIYLNGGGSLGVGMKGITKITVVMENGQMSGVPWFAVWDHDKIVRKFNGANLDGVSYI